MGRETEFESATFRATIFRQNSTTSNNDNKLQDNTNSKVTKSCLNRVQNDQNPADKHQSNNAVAEAVLEISKLPLSDDEKAQMIRMLLK